MSITHYYKCYDDDLDGLIEKMKPEYLSSNLWNNIDIENDVFLMHCIYEVIKTTPLYHKKEIQDYIWDKIEPNIAIPEKTSFFRSIESFKAGYDLLFDHCWRHKFTNGGKEKEICKIAYDSRPFSNKLYNSNIALIIFSLLTIISQVLIHNSFDLLRYADETPFQLLIITATFWLMGIAFGASIKNLRFAPLFVFICMICKSYYYILNPCTIGIEHNMEAFRFDAVVEFAQRNLAIGLIFLLWIPIICTNVERLDDYCASIERKK